jgi:hypothetical protein
VKRCNAGAGIAPVEDYGMPATKVVPTTAPLGDDDHNKPETITDKSRSGILAR